MALKSSREGLRKELVDYLGNIIIDDNLKQNITNSIGDVFIDNEELSTSVNELDEKIRNETSARELADTNLSDKICIVSSGAFSVLSVSWQHLSFCFLAFSALIHFWANTLTILVSIFFNQFCMQLS